ncbi:trigger factor [Mycoplasmopsis felifaucium]|uniref:Trigger factor n=1 Tax=Mycoplasmopsis felifaucium TaxID=35768 RepID=A0ABZ2RPM6_9BACT
MVIKKIELNKEKTAVVVEVEFSGENWKKIYDATKAKKVKEVKIPGFRPGKAPKAEIDKRVTPVTVAYDAIEKAYASENEAILEGVKKEFPNVVAMASLLDLPVLGEEASVVKLELPVMPDLSELKLSKVKVDYVKAKVGKKEIETELHKIFEAEALLMPLKEGELTQTGDVVTLNYKGYVNNEPFNGGEAQNYELKLGSKQFIDNFEEQLTNKKVGWKGEVNVKFPDTYPVPTLKGQKAVFECEIVEAKRLESIEITDEKVKALNQPGIETVKQLEAQVKEQLLINEILNSDNQLVQNVAKALLDEYKPQIASVLAKEETDKKMAEVKKQLKSQGVKLEEYLSLISLNEEEYYKTVLEETKQEMLIQFITRHLYEEFSKDSIITEENKLFAYVLMSDSSRVPLNILLQIILMSKDSKDNKIGEMIEMQAKNAAFLQYLTASMNKEASEHNHAEIAKLVSKTIKSVEKEIAENKKTQEEAKKSEETTKETK